MIELLPGVLTKIFRWVRYLYFLRFALILWFFAPLMVALNSTGASSLIRGILVPDYFFQYLCIGFFLVSASFAALILARLVVGDGPERFNEGVPRSLKWLLVNDQGHWLLETWVLLLSQAPNLVIFFLIGGNSQREGVAAYGIWWGLGVGSVLAALIWWAANAAFYLAYVAPLPFGPIAPQPIILGKNAARTMLFPRAWFGLYRPGAPLIRGHATLENAYTPLRNSRLMDWFNRSAHFLDKVFKLTGYLYPDGTVYEGHSFAMVATAVFALIFFALWPLAAPVPARTASHMALGFLFGAGGAMLLLVSKSRSNEGRHLSVWKGALSAGVALSLLSVLGFYYLTPAGRFPVFAVLLILATLLLWALGGIAFFADRYRIPVLTTFLACMLLPRLFGVYGGAEEHYLSTSVVHSAAKPAGAPTPDSEFRLLTPAAILDSRLNNPADPQNPDQPMIIVTSTGGGLHASAWTSAVLAHLEIEFARHGISFRRNVLLMSTVSGGSVGLVSYLREITDPVPDWVRMQTVAQCSSLEAVGWGLVYYDAPKALVPLAPFVLSSSSGDNDLNNSPLLKDRTWALRKAFARNTDDAYCAFDRKTVEEYFAEDAYRSPSQDPTGNASHPSRRDDPSDQQNPQNVENRLTVRNLLPNLDGSHPAFTMNTTTVERGQRFLLANYRVPQYPLDSASDYPAQSFIDTLGCCKDKAFDLPLVTAAQLSATFPLVSSAARAPKAADWHSVHFVDGGYYDNDGTSSVLEFLRYALGRPEDAQEKEEKLLLQDIETKLLPKEIDRKAAKEHPLRILLIEIRNSADPEVEDEIQDQQAQRLGGGRGAETTDWGLFDQMLAPLEGFWNAGHEAVTGKNRASLSLLEQALYKKLRVHRIVFDDRNSESEVGTDPLSWSLTPKERTEVLSSSCPRKMRDHYKEAAHWFIKPREEWQSDALLHSSAPEAVPGAAATPTLAPPPAQASAEAAQKP